MNKNQKAIAKATDTILGAVDGTDYEGHFLHLLKLLEKDSAKSSFLSGMKVGHTIVYLTQAQRNMKASNKKMIVLDALLELDESLGLND